MARRPRAVRGGAPTPAPLTAAHRRGRRAGGSRARRTAGGRQEEPAPPWLRAAIAHRGLHDGNRLVPENSLPAFEAAAAAGVPIELDVRLSADGEPVVHHDATLRRLCGTAGRVGDLRADQLARRRLAGTAATIPSLGEVLAVVAGRVPVMVEVKPLARGTARLCQRVDDLLARYEGPASVHSFHPGVVRWLARRSPGLLRGQAVGAGRGPVLLQRALDALGSGGWPRPQFVVVGLDRLDDPRTRLLRAGGVPVLAFTVRTGAEQRRAIAAADGYFYEAWDADDPVVDVPRPG